MLKYSYTNEADIPEDLRKHYVLVESVYFLECEGAVASAKLDEFRTNNIALKKEAEKFAGIDPAEYKKLLEKQKTFESASADNEEKIKDIVEKRVADMVKDHGEALEKLTTENAGHLVNLSRLTIDQSVLGEAIKLGLRKGADNDIVARANSVWKLEEGKPVAYKPDGEQIFGKSGTQISVQEWTAGLAKEAPHLFDENAGGGAGGGGDGGGGDKGAVNPWRKDTFNLTNQGKILTADPDKARTLAAQAGVKI